MTWGIRIKNCGIKTPGALDASLRSGAEYIGFILHPESPRNIAPDVAATLAQSLPSSVQSVAVMVNPTNEALDTLLSIWRPDLLQLHGDEPPHRVSSIRAHTSLPVIKALPVATADDVQKAKHYYTLADMLLFDTKTEQHGGSGQSFDWTLLKGAQFPLPWFLSGGLNAENVGEALHITAAPMVDVSSGIESGRGIKDHAKIAAFNEAVRQFII